MSVLVNEATEAQFNTSVVIGPPSLRPASGRWRIAAVFAGLVIVASVLRLVHLELIEFRFDSAYWATEAMDILNGHLPLIGQQIGSVTVPLYNGPIFGYLIALVFHLAGTAEPLAMAAVMGALGAAAVASCGGLGYLLFGEGVGRTAAMLLVGAPWMVLFTRMIWPQSLFPLLVPISAGVLYVGVTRRKPLYLLVWGILTGVCIELHLSALALIPAGMLFMALYFRRAAPLVAGMVGLAIGYAPVIIYDAANGWQQMRGILGVGGVRMAQDANWMSHLARFGWDFENVLSGQGLWVSKLGFQTSYLPGWVEWGQGAALAILGILAVGGYANAYLRGRAGDNLLTRADVVCILYAGVPLIYLAASNGPILRHYFLLLVPIVFLLIARGLSLVHATWQKYAWGGVIALVLLNLFTCVEMTQFLTSARSGWDYGTVLEDKLQAVAWIEAQSADGFVVDASRTREALAYYALLRAQAPATFDERLGVIRSTSGRAMPRTCIMIIEPQFYDVPTAVAGRPRQRFGKIELVQLEPLCRFWGSRE